jgi:predicted GNAT superfamily acetyltransferase
MQKETTLTLVRDACLKDWSYIESLRRKEGHALGFIPKGAYLSILERQQIDVHHRYLSSRILVTVDNQDLTGFCYASYAGDYAKIFQIVVQEDARRWHRALKMVETVEEDARRYGKLGVTCRVAFDLESSFFWRAIGYMPVKQVTSTWLNQRESKSKRPL